jgi:predicted NBD/HSP70 family sugar kinase
MLDFNPTAGYVLAVEIGRTGQRVALTDLNGKIIAARKVQVEVRESKETILAAILAECDTLVLEQGIRRSQLVGTGVTITGLVDAVHGIVRAFRPDWDNTNLREVFEAHFAVPAFVEGDSKAITIAEQQLGAGRGKRNHVCICFTDAGPSAGIVHNEHLLRGVTDSAGEVGSISVGYLVKDKSLFTSLLPTEGNVTFDQVLRKDVPREILRRQISASGDPWQSAPARRPAHFTNAYVAEAAALGDPLSLEILTEYGELAAILCLNIINFLNPEQIILHGEIFWTNDVVLEVIRRAVSHHVLAIPAQAVAIVSSVLKEDAVLLGAASLVLSDLFSRPEVRRVSQGRKPPFYTS